MRTPTLAPNLRTASIFAVVGTGKVCRAGSISYA